MLGLSCVPALPYLFDHPVEKATDIAFEWVEEQVAHAGKSKGHKEL